MRINPSSLPFTNCPPPEETDDDYCHLPILSLTGYAVVDSSGGKIMLGQHTLAISTHLVENPTNFKLTILPANQSPHPLPSYIIPLSDYIIISSDAEEFNRESASIGLISPYDRVKISQSAPEPDLFTWYKVVQEDFHREPIFWDFPVDGLAQGFIYDLIDDPAIPSQGLAVKEGFQFGAVKMNEAMSACISSGGIWDGYSCIGGEGRRWSYSQGLCIQNTQGTGSSGFSGLRSGLEATGGVGGGDSIYTTLTANVGNAAVKCLKHGYKNKLCWKTDEEEVRERVQNDLDPDIVFLQELFNPQSLCDTLAERGIE